MCMEQVDALRLQESPTEVEHRGEERDANHSHDRGATTPTCLASGSRPPGRGNSSTRVHLSGSAGGSRLQAASRASWSVATSWSSTQRGADGLPDVGERPGVGGDEVFPGARQVIAGAAYPPVPVPPVGRPHDDCDLHRGVLQPARAHPHDLDLACHGSGGRSIFLRLRGTP
jgi:hypothetical protein